MSCAVQDVGNNPSGLDPDGVVCRSARPADTPPLNLKTGGEQPCRCPHSSFVRMPGRKEVVGPVKLRESLSRKRSSIVEKWFDRIIETYPEDTSKFLKKEKDPFANPVRNTILEGIEGVYGELLKETESAEELNDFLDKVIRIRAVQEFSPSQALAFVFSLKKVIREVLGKEIRENHLQDQLLLIETRIDALALRAFDVYVGCREEVFELRVNEVKRMRERAFRLLEQTDRVYLKKKKKNEEAPSRDSE